MGYPSRHTLTHVHAVQGRGCGSNSAPSVWGVVGVSAMVRAAKQEGMCVTIVVQREVTVPFVYLKKVLSGTVCIFVTLLLSFSTAD